MAKNQFVEENKKFLKLNFTAEKNCSRLFSQKKGFSYSLFHCANGRQLVQTNIPSANQL